MQEVTWIRLLDSGVYERERCVAFLFWGELAVDKLQEY